MSWIAVGVGATIAATKHFAVDQPAANRKRQLAASTERYSPWTGLHGQVPEDPNLAGSMLEGAAQGGAMKQGIDTTKAATNYQNALSNRVNSGGSPVGTGPAFSSELTATSSSPFWGKSSYTPLRKTSRTPWSLYK